MNDAKKRLLSALRRVTFHPQVAPFHGDGSHVCNAMDEAFPQLQSSILCLQRTGFRVNKPITISTSIHTLPTMDMHAAGARLEPTCKLATHLCPGDKKPRDASQVAAMQCNPIARGTEADNAAISAWQNGSDHYAFKASPAHTCLPSATCDIQMTVRTGRLLESIMTLSFIKVGCQAYIQTAGILSCGAHEAQLVLPGIA